MFFDAVEQAAIDPVFGIDAAFREDQRPGKINLTIGIYKDENGKTLPLSSVLKARDSLKEKEISYLPILGHNEFREELGLLLFAKEWEEHKSRISVAQAIGGTGAVRLCGAFLSQEGVKNIAISNPTWPNHQAIFTRCNLKLFEYPYYNEKSHSVDFSKICDSISKMEKKSAILLQPVCHNPTGADFSKKEWLEIFALLEKKEIIPLFDFAYHGFGEGLQEDFWPIMEYLKTGREMMIAYSCSKNFGLYSQRVGAVFIVAKNESVKHKVESQLLRIIRSMYSNPPEYGALLAATVLKDPNLKKMWENEVDEMRNRLLTMRKKFTEELTLKTKQDKFGFILKQNGMFSFLDLRKDQVAKLREKYAIYLLDSGRISIAALNEKNMNFVTDALSTIDNE